MKRIISLIMVVSLCLCLCACGSKESAAPAATESSVNAPAAEAAAEAPTEAPDPFAELPEHYTIQTPIYTLYQFYSSLGNDTYTYSNIIHDEDGRIVSLDKQENDHRAFTYTCTYDENCNLASVTYHHSLYGSTETYTYNDLGQLISLYETEPDDAEYYMERTYTYNDNGMPSSDRTSSSSDFYDGGGSDITYESDASGRIVSRADCSLDDYNNLDDFIYNDAGQLLEETSRTIDEGTHKYTYETTYQYNVYGFPVVANVDNSFDYKGDTVKWQCRSEYAVTGYHTHSSETGDVLNPTTQWNSFQESAIVPTPDSVIPALTLQSAESSTYKYAIPTNSNAIPSTNIFGIMQGLDDFGRIDLRAYSVQAEANEFLWRYTAALEQVLGLQIAEFEDAIVVMDGSFTLATMAIEYTDGTYYLTISVNHTQSSAQTTQTPASPAGTVSTDPIMEVEALLQGTWEYYDSNLGYGEILIFDNGSVRYNSYVDTAKNNDPPTVGTYRVTEDNVITTMNNFDAYFDYEVSGQRLSLSWFIDSGADANNVRVYAQIEKGSLDPNYRPSQNNAPAATPSNKTASSNASSNSSSSSTASSTTMGERNALADAKLYLNVMAFSYEGLIDQLEYEGYTYSEAKYGADNCGADWFEQAALCAAQYLDVMPFSRSELIDQLEYEGFTSAQAEYGVKQNGY